MAGGASAFPKALDHYPPVGPDGLLAALAQRVADTPFNAVATTIFVLAIVHTFLAPRIMRASHRVQHLSDAQRRAAGLAPQPSFRAEILHFFGEIEVVFGLWVVPLILAILGFYGWTGVTRYLDGTVNFTEPLFVVVIMALASSRPIISFADGVLRKLADLGGGTAASWWTAILIVGPVLGSFITEPAAMTICALLLSRQVYRLGPSPRLMYATLGLLFVSVSIGGTLTHFAAPPVLMVARPWGWDTAFMLTSYGWKAVLAIVVSTLLYRVAMRKDLADLEARRRAMGAAGVESNADGSAALPVPAWITSVHLAFLAWTVFTAHYPALFLGGFLFFLGFTRATSPFQSRIDLRAPLLVGMFLAGLVIHGGLQGWWIAPVLGSLSPLPLFASAAALTAFNDNALITYLATLVPGLGDAMKYAVVAGAVAGGGLTVIANAPNPAGQSILAPYFENSVSPLRLLAGAVVPTVIASTAFLLL